MSTLFAGCSAGVSGISGLSGLGPSKLQYQASNAIMASGFSETALAPDHYRIEVTAYPTTSRERMEKVAATRAAEIGKENRLGYFKINNVEQTTRCKKYTAGGTRGGTGTEERKLAYVAIDRRRHLYQGTPGYDLRRGKDRLRSVQGRARRGRNAAAAGRFRRRNLQLSASSA